MARNDRVTKADFYEAAEKFFPEHDIVFEKTELSDRRFTDCMVGDRLVMRYCPPYDKFCWPADIIVFTKDRTPLDCITQDGLVTIIASLLEEEHK